MGSQNRKKSAHGVLRDTIESHPFHFVCSRGCSQPRRASGQGKRGWSHHQTRGRSRRVVLCPGRDALTLVGGRSCPVFACQLLAAGSVCRQLIGTGRRLFDGLVVRARSQAERASVQDRSRSPIRFAIKVVAYRGFSLARRSIAAASGPMVARKRSLRIASTITRPAS